MAQQAAKPLVNPETKPDTKPDDVNEDALETEEKRDKTLAEKLESGKFAETDADDDPENRGWITLRATFDKDGNELTREHRVPVQYWARYSRIHNL